MVVTMFWVPSWWVPVISIGVLCMAVMFLLCCLCLQKKQSDSLKIIVPSRRRNFMDFSNSSLNRLMLFRNLNSSNNAPDDSKAGSDSELLDNEDLSKRFDCSCLKIEGLDEKDQDVKSCDSGDSRYTFYSTYPFTRSVSALSDTATYKSMRNSLVIPNSRQTSSSNMLCLNFE